MSAYARLPRFVRRLGLPVACLVVGSSVYVRGLSGQNPQAPVAAPAMDAEFAAKVLPHLTNTCVTCHDPHAPDNRARMLAMDPDWFAAKMEAWGPTFLPYPDSPVPGNEPVPATT